MADRFSQIHAEDIEAKYKVDYYLHLRNTSLTEPYQRGLARKLAQNRFMKIIAPNLNYQDLKALSGPQIDRKIQKYMNRDFRTSSKTGIIQKFIYPKRNDYRIPKAVKIYLKNNYRVIVRYDALDRGIEKKNNFKVLTKEPYLHIDYVFNPDSETKLSNIVYIIQLLPKRHRQGGCAHKSNMIEINGITCFSVSSRNNDCGIVAVKNLFDTNIRDKILNEKSKNNNFSNGKLRKALGLPLNKMLEPIQLIAIYNKINGELRDRKIINDYPQDLEIINESSEHLAGLNKDTNKKRRILFYNQHYYNMDIQHEITTNTTNTNNATEPTNEMSTVIIQDNIDSIDSIEPIISPSNAQMISESMFKNRNELMKYIKNSSKNVIIYGNAGVGKTYMLKELHKQMGGEITGTTGISSNNVGGQTVHRFIQSTEGSKKKINLFIDEMSMLNGNIYFKVLQHRLILTGDLYQLPVVDKDGSIPFYKHPSFSFEDYLMVKLTTVYRTDDKEFLEACDKVRENNRADEKYKLNSYPDYTKYKMILTPVNKEADQINNKMIEYYAKKSNESIFEVRTKQYVKTHIDPNKANMESTTEELKDVARKIEEINRASLKLFNGCQIILTANIKGMAYTSFKNGNESESIYGTHNLYNGKVGTFNKKEDGIYIDEYKITSYKVRYTDPIGKFIIEYEEVPIKLGYCITIHKSQGLTFDFPYLLLINNRLFLEQLFYVAMTRATKGKYFNWYGEGIKLEGPPLAAVKYFYEGIKVDINSKPLGYVKKIQTNVFQYAEKTKYTPHNIFYYDLETALYKGNHVPYMAQLYVQNNAGYRNEHVYIISSIKDIEKLNEIYEYKIKFVESKYVVKKMMYYVLLQVSDFIEKYKLDTKTFNRKTFNTASKNCCILCGYNSCCFDDILLFKEMQSFLTRSKGWEHKFILKNCGLLNYTLYYKSFPVLRCHDINQILNMKLKHACKAFLPNEPGKIEFKEQIIDMVNFMFNENGESPSIEELKQERTITKITTDKSLFNRNRKFHTEPIKYCPFESIEYGIRDVEVLPKLYNAVGELVTKMLTDSESEKYNAYDFLTMGSTTFYGLLKNLPTKATHGKKNKKVNTCLYKMDLETTNFIRRSIYGGRSCPRINKAEGEYVYVDICGMYGSVMMKYYFPSGKPKQISEHTANLYINGALKTLKNLSDIDKNTLPMGFMECDFQECENRLEPIIQCKDNNKTIYTVERRNNQVITFLDAIMIKLTGGQIFKIHKALAFPKCSKYAHKWISRCTEYKTKYKKSNPGLSVIAKLMANAAYGQSLKNDYHDSHAVCYTPEDLDKYLKCNTFNYAILGEDNTDEPDIVTGFKKNWISDFSGRPIYMGSYVLAYTRLMIAKIIDVINPKQKIHKQPILGDTDSLVITKKQALKLQKEGMFAPDANTPGMLNDELRDILSKKGVQFKENEMCIIKKVISPAPKILAVEFYKESEPDKMYYKFRLKGISKIAFLKNNKESNEVISAGAIFDAFENTNTIKCDLDGGLKKTLASRGTKYKDTFTIKSNNLVRNVLKYKWEGRKRIEDTHFTVPYGWKPNN